MRSILALASAIALSSFAHASVLDIPLAGWQADGGYLSPLNTSTTINLPVGTTIDNAEYLDLSYTAQGASWRSDLVLSLNDSEAFISYWDTKISGAPDSSGVYGPISAGFDNPPWGGDGPFTLTTGQLYVEAYDVFNDAGIDEVIAGGTLRIHYTVPEPASAMLLSILGVFGLRRR